MSDMDVFVIDDDFDPLADLELVEEGEGQETDYMPPIPDADKSVMPEVVPLTPQERIEKLLAGIPGQQFRLLRAVELCAEPKTLDEVVEVLDVEHPQRASVYDAAQVVRLLERDGALERLEDEASADEPPVEQDPEADYLVVTPAPLARFVATEAGLQAVADHVGERVVVDMLNEESQYLPLYRTILEMCSVEGGGSTKELNAVVDVDPLCEEPRRFCTYFLGKLETAGALVWRDAWVVTDLGARVFASDIFAN